MLVGGDAKLSSFGLAAGRLTSMGVARRKALLSAYIPREPLDFLSALPAALQFPGVTFVHAGMRPGIALKDQNEHGALDATISRLWHEPERDMVIHGHDQARAPVLLPSQICLDTGHAPPAP